MQAFLAVASTRVVVVAASFSEEAGSGVAESMEDPSTEIACEDRMEEMVE
jgi:hypothetical protein